MLPSVTTLGDFLLKTFHNACRKPEATLDTPDTHRSDWGIQVLQRLVLAYKNFAAHQNISHIGLGVSALNTCKVLRRAGMIADVWPIMSAKDLTADCSAIPPRT